MARSHLTLAALAAATVADFDPTSVRILSAGGHGDFDAVLVENATGKRVLVRAGNNPAADEQLTKEAFTTQAMSAGIRSRLSFDVPTVIARIPQPGFQALVLEYLDGQLISVGDIQGGEGLPVSIGRAVAGIHSLPVNFVSEAGLPAFSATEIQHQTQQLINQARRTNLLPAVLVERWEAAGRDAGLWQFEPTAIHGSLSADSFIIGEDSVSAVLGWSSLRVGDPAWDLHWLVNVSTQAQEAAFGAYIAAREPSADPRLTQRAVLYSELELARWLLHGVEKQDQSIIDDAVDMLDRLVDTVNSEGENTVGVGTQPVLTVTEVAELLAETPGDITDLATRDYRGMEPVTDDQRSSNSLSE